MNQSGFVGDENTFFGVFSSKSVKPALANVFELIFRFPTPTITNPSKPEFLSCCSALDRTTLEEVNVEINKKGKPSQLCFVNVTTLKFLMNVFVISLPPMSTNDDVEYQ